ncbi:MAG: sodium:calcium symporter, partial [Acidobacteriota bacterium]
QPVVFIKPFLGEMDFWAGTFGLAVFALVEVILFAWVFGMDRAWEEITRGADIRIPRFFYYTIRYITPFFLIIILAVWTWQDALPRLMMDNVDQADRPGVLWARVVLVGIMSSLLLLIGYAWRRRDHAARSS